MVSKGWRSTVPNVIRCESDIPTIHVANPIAFYLFKVENKSAQVKSE